MGLEWITVDIYIYTIMYIYVYIYTHMHCIHDISMHVETVDMYIYIANK